MKKNFLLLVIAATILSGCGEMATSSKDVVKETYIQKHGFEVSKESWEARGSDGKIVSFKDNGSTITATYSKGLLHGQKTFSFLHSSKIARVEVYSEGVLTEKIWNFESELPQKKEVIHSPSSSTITSWYITGTPKSIETYSSSLLESGKYFTQENTLESSVSDYSGKSTYRSERGALNYIDEISDGQITFRESYYPSGSVHMRSSYENGIMHGENRIFAESGEPLSTELWSYGSQHGLTIKFKNGSKFSETTYVSGKKQGLEKVFNDDGIVTEEISWESDKKHGPTHIYIEDMTYTKWYCKDKLVSKSTFSEYKKHSR